MATHDPLNRRKEAKAASAVTYDTGIPCVNGHVSPRYTATKLCVECKKQTFKKQYQSNKQRWLAYSENWRKENRQHILDYAKQYREKYPDKVKQVTQEYRKRNKDKHCSLERMRQAAKLKAIPIWLTKKQNQDIKNVYLKSKEISTASGIKMHVDHIVPLKGKTVCGLHVPWNLRVIDGSQNSKKRAALTDDAYLPALDGVMLTGKALPWNWSNV